MFADQPPPDPEPPEAEIEALRCPLLDDLGVGEVGDTMAGINAVAAAAQAGSEK